MPYDFQKLQIVHCFDAVTVRVPARWQCGPSTKLDDFWCCYEDDEETGTLWIKVDRYFRPDHVPADPSFPLRRIVDTMVSEWPAETHFLESEIIEIPDGYLWKNVSDSDDKGEQTRNFRYFFFHLGDHGYAVTDLNFVLLVSQVEEPEFRDLIAMMDREIRGASIDPFSWDKVEPGGEIFKPLRRVNFGDQVKVVLPERLEGGDSEEPGQWNCFFEPDDVEARFFVMCSNHTLAEKGSREDVILDQEFYDQIVSRFLDQSGGEYALSEVRGGILGYIIYDEPAEPEQTAASSDWRAGPVRNHLWRYFRFQSGRIRQAQFLLMVSQGRAETAELTAFVKLLDREIRRAEFPGLDSPR